MSEQKFGFFFGAGAEICYELPSGSDFTKETICKKHEELYNALGKVIYNGEFGDYVGKYKKNFHFRSNSADFREMVLRAAININEAKRTPAIKHLASEHTQKEKDSNFRYSKIYQDIESALYKYIVEDNKEQFKKGRLTIKKRKKDSLILTIEDCEKITDNLSYYGTMEEKFSTICNPKKAGEWKFWSLINYFWSCYFSIFEPLAKKTDIYEQSSVKNKHKYEFMLKNLTSILNEIEHEDFLNKFDSNKNYYKQLKNFNPSCVITTNYTPFIETIFTKDKSSYLAGRLSDFEVPNKFLIDKFDNIDKKDFKFPYMLTQAPIKPIIHPTQILEYSKAIKALEEIKTLVIIGYNINENDDHINAILKDFCTKDEKNKIIYCYYNKDKFDAEKTKLEVCKRLHIEDDSEQIIIIENNGDVKGLKSILIEQLNITNPNKELAFAKV